MNKNTAAVRELASEHGPTAIRELARLAKEAQSESARVQACSLIIERAYGRAVPSRPIQIALPDTSTVAGVTEAVAAIIQATAAGQVTPAEASDLCRLLEAQRKAIELSEIEARLVRLESVQT